MNGSHAQMFKGLLKAFGPSIIAPFQPKLEVAILKSHCQI